MEEPARLIRLEPRWPVALAILVLIFVLTMLPARVRLLPFWVPYVLGIMLLLPMAGVWLSKADARWLSIERKATLIFALIAEVVTLTTLSYLILEMLDRPADFSGRQLLVTSIAAWLTNVLAFSLEYWRIDCGGPEPRASDAGIRPDWLFPQSGVPEKAPSDWRPTYVDYLSLSFSTAMAFSTCDVIPLTSRAKMLMMLESAVSLSTLVIVASRAINILG